MNENVCLSNDIQMLNSLVLFLNVGNIIVNSNRETNVTVQSPQCVLINKDNE